MITSAPFQWILSVVFIATTMYSIYWVLQSWNARDRVSYATHALMSLGMFAMIWPWGMDLLIGSQIVVFSLATVWFVALIASHRTSRRSLTHSDGHHDGRPKLAYHAGMMAAMVVMAVAMLGIRSRDMTASVATSGGSMPGMDMSGAAATSLASPLWVNVLAITCVIGFAVAAIYFIGSLLASSTSADRVTRPGRFRIADAVWNLSMAGGMAVLFLPLISWS